VSYDPSAPLPDHVPHLTKVPPRRTADIRQRVYSGAIMLTAFTAIVIWGREVGLSLLVLVVQAMSYWEVSEWMNDIISSLPYQNDTPTIHGNQSSLILWSSFVVFVL